jgi:hypothetical protein
VLALDELESDTAKNLGGAEYLHQVGNGQNWSGSHMDL